MDNKKTQRTVHFPQKTLDKIESLQKINDGKSRNQIIEEAIDFYYGYKTSELSQDFICSIYGQKVEGIVGSMSDRISRLLFKMSVETNVSTRVIASQLGISKVEYDKMRKAAVEDARSTKGIISVFDV